MAVASAILRPALDPELDPEPELAEAVATPRDRRGRAERARRAEFEKRRALILLKSM